MIARPLLFALLLVPAAGARAAPGLFAGGAAGPALLREEGHAPPLCCYERETWSAPGARVGGTLGWAFAPGLRLGLEAGVAFYQVVGPQPFDLRLLSPDAAARVGWRIRWPSLSLDLAAGAGWRRFSGRAHFAEGGTRAVAADAPDLRASIGLLVPTAAGHHLGAELSLVKVLIEQTVAVLSLVIGWERGPSGGP